MIDINKIQLQIKIKNIKKQLTNCWYKLMKPLAKLINKIEKRNSEKFYKKAESMATEDVIKRLTKLIVKDLVRYSDSKWNYNLELEVARRCAYYEEGKTIIEYMKRQSKDKKLSHYAYRILDKDLLSKNKELADLLVRKSLKELGFNIKLHKREYPLGYSYKRPEEYQYTIKISL